MRFERALLEARACGVPRIDVLDDNPKLASLLEGPILSHDFYAQQLRLGLRCALCLARGTDRHHRGCERGDDGVDGVDGHHSEGDSCPSCPARGSRRHSSRSSGAPQTDADGPSCPSCPSCPSFPRPQRAASPSLSPWWEVTAHELVGKIAALQPSSNAHDEASAARFREQQDNSR